MFYEIERSKAKLEQRVTTGVHKDVALIGAMMEDSNGDDNDVDRYIVQRLARLKVAMQASSSQ